MTKHPNLEPFDIKKSKRPNLEPFDLESRTRAQTSNPSTWKRYQVNKPRTLRPWIECARLNIDPSTLKKNQAVNPSGILVGFWRDSGGIAVGFSCASNWIVKLIQTKTQKAIRMNSNRYRGQWVMRGPYRGQWVMRGRGFTTRVATLIEKATKLQRGLQPWSKKTTKLHRGLQP